MTISRECGLINSNRKHYIVVHFEHKRRHKYARIIQNVLNLDDFGKRSLASRIQVIQLSATLIYPKEDFIQTFQFWLSQNNNKRACSVTYWISMSVLNIILDFNWISYLNITWYLHLCTIIYWPILLSLTFLYWH